MDKLKQLLVNLKDSIGEAAFKLILAQVLTPKNIIAAVDAVLDVAEEVAAKTETKIDDEAITKIREALNIPKDKQNA